MYTLEEGMQRYICKMQDTFGKLQVGKIYNIKDYVIYNDFSNIPIYHLSRWQLNNMFEKV